MQLIKEITIDFVKNVKYFQLKTTKTCLDYGFKKCVLKVTEYNGTKKEERFYANEGSELDWSCYRSKFTTNA